MNSNTTAAILASAALLAAATVPSLGQERVVVFNGLPVVPGEVTLGVGQVLTPLSSVEQPGDRGRRAHTNYKILSRRGAAVPSGDVSTAQLVPTDPNLNTPASLACIYGLVPVTHGCDPRKVLKTAKGGSRTIAIVDAFHNPTALADLQKFSSDLGLLAPKLQVVYCSSSQCGVSSPPPVDQGWAGEIALDIQWAHAMAPRAKIILVEANSNSYHDLMLAEDEAARLVAKTGGEVSNSWGGSEFSQETQYDTHFVKNGVVFFASTGDHKCAQPCADVEYPSISPNVVGVGGTSITRTAKGTYRSQSAWVDTGGGLSTVYSRPKFQDNVQNRVGNVRGVPDISWLADPNTGAFVYCSAGTCGSTGGYFIFGGTSLAAPAIAGMTNAAGNFRASSNAQNTFQYPGLGGANYLDVITGSCGNGPNGAAVRAATGWDRCTGVGAPKGLSGL